ncbi:MAG TPA: NAD(P)H-hydrate dehydratase [Candidatus Eisenbacteria bacterium]|jgi:NAD(P)H-hydrate epimerase
MRFPPVGLPLVTAAEMAALDREAIQGRGIPSLRLMERAGRGVAREIAAWWRVRGGRPTGAEAAGGGARRGRAASAGRVGSGRVALLAGRGNNGGDGFVCARHLRAMGYAPRVLVAADEAELSPDARANREACARARVPVVFFPEPAAWDPGGEAARACAEADLIVDALLGTGSRGAPRDAIARAIECANHQARPVVSIDIPSGLDASTGHVETPTVRAALTITLALPKRGLAIEPGRSRAGEVRVVEIGIPDDLIAAVTPGLRKATAAWARSLLPRRPMDAHKGTTGRVLLVGGSAGLMGAVGMAGETVLRSGAGYCVAAVPESCLPILEARAAEVVKRGLPETQARSLASAAAEAIAAEAERADVIAIGPGLSRDAETAELARQLLMMLDAPLVLDADGLNAFEGRGVRRSRGPLVLTPHYGEAARISGRTIAEVARDPIGWARAYADDSGAIVCLKSTPMITAVPGQPAILNDTGNPGMATAGAGDVLTGLIAGFIAQGVDPAEAASLGCYVHGLAGDVALRRMGMRGMIAGDILRAVPAALIALESGALDEEDPDAASWDPGSA